MNQTKPGELKQIWVPLELQLENVPTIGNYNPDNPIYKRKLNVTIDDNNVIRPIITEET